MKRTNPMMIAGVALNMLVAFSVYQSPEFPYILGIILVLFGLIGIIGVIITATLPSQVGPFLVIISAVAFLPIGFLAAFGARKARDEMTRAEFEKNPEQK